MKTFELLGPDGSSYESSSPGQLGGYRPRRIYGRLDCPSALRHIAKGGYTANRVFFADEAAAIAAGYRPCAKCLPSRYDEWKRGGTPGSANYPWLLQPKSLAGAAQSAASSVRSLKCAKHTA